METKHGKNREKVCVCCLCRGNSKPITEEEVKAFQQKCKPDYDPSDPYVPIGLCVSCRLRLMAKNDGRGNPTILKVGNYSEICTPGKKMTRQTNNYINKLISN